MAKYGINLLLWSGSFNNDSLPLIQKVADFGFDGVEIPIFDPAEVDIKATKKSLENSRHRNHNLRYTGFRSGYDKRRSSNS